MVLVARRVLVVEVLLEDAFRLEPAQAGGEDVARSARVARDRVEAADAERELPHDEQRPLLAEDLEGARGRAGPGVLAEYAPIVP